MLEVLDSPDIRMQVVPISIDRYHRMIECGLLDEWTVELLQGVIVRKISKSELHLFVVDWLLEHLLQFCAGSEWWVRKEDPILMGDSEPEPDISVIMGTRSQFRHSKPTHAQFVIEVAISSLSIDRAKASIYAQAGIPEYWIILPEAAMIEVYRQPENGRYTEIIEIASTTLLESSALPGFAVDLRQGSFRITDGQKFPDISDSYRVAVMVALSDDPILSIVVFIVRSHCRWDAHCPLIFKCCSVASGSR